MYNNGNTETFMTDCRKSFTHYPEDVLSLRNCIWLTGTIIDTFFTCMNFNYLDGTFNNTINILRTTFYPLLLNTASNDSTVPEWNTFNYNAVREFTSQDTRLDILKETIIPIHIPGHWLLCIINPTTKKIYIVDSLRHNNANIIKYIREWFILEMNRLEYGTSQNSEYNIYTWEILKENNLPDSLPI
jgi:Ulp1 family protease